MWNAIIGRVFCVYKHLPIVLGHLQNCPDRHHHPRLQSTGAENPVLCFAAKTVVPIPRAADWPVRNRAAQQEMRGGWMSKASSVFTAVPHCSHYHLSSTSCQHYGELYNYFIIYYDVIIIEIKCTIKVMRLNHPQTISPAPRSVEKLSST